MDDHRNERIETADYSGAHFHGVVFSNVKITDALLFGVDISGLVGGLTVNGVDVGPYVDAELDRRHPERVKLRALDPDGMRAAWETIEGFTATTLERARTLPPEELAERVDGEFSFLQTLRHLIYATDRWITGPVLEESEPFHRLGWPNEPIEWGPTDVLELDAEPGLDQIVAARRGRMDRVAGVLRDIDDAGLARELPSPNGGTTTVMSCLHVVFREEWEHDQYANRDLAVLEAH